MVKKGHWYRSIMAIGSAFFHWIKKTDFRGVRTNGKPLMAEVVESTKWLNPETIRRAKKSARYKANAARWNLEIAIFLFAILILVLLLINYTRAGLGLVTFTSVFGLAMVWLVGWRRGRQLYKHYYNEELAQCPDDWKDYYKTLRLSPSAKSETINEAYQRLTHPYKEALSDKAKSIPVYSLMLREINEAYEVLSDHINRINYDRVFWLKYNAGDTGINEYAKNELIGLSESISQQVLKSERVITWRIPILGKVTRRVAIGVAIFLLAIGIGGTSFAFVKPEHAMAAPFRGVAVTLAKATTGAIELIEGVRGIAASQERTIVSTALQSMRINEGLKFVPPVTVPTNDMTLFPSSECCLFPDYLETRFSQFRYTVDSKGIVVVDTSWATTDPFVDNIKKLILRLEEREYGVNP